MPMSLLGILFVGLHLFSSTAQAVVPYNAAHKHNDLADLSTENVEVQMNSRVVITTNTTVVETSGQWVELSWCCVPNPAKDDWIGLYAPGDADPMLYSPAVRWIVGGVDGYMESGAGSLSVKVFNHRTDFIKFMFMKKTYKGNVAIGISNALKVMNANQPLQGHLALTGNERELLIQWNSKDGGSPQVVWGDKSNEYTYSSAGETNTYTEDDICLATSGWVDPGALHHALMTNLEPGKQYFYKYGDKIHGMSEEFTFFGPPLKGSTKAVKFIAYGDLGTDGDPYCKGASNTITQLLKEVEDTHLLLHNGDISYAMGYGGFWDRFMEQIKPLATRVPYMTSVGNHERDWPNTGDRYHGLSDDSGGECGVAYRRRFRMPVAEPESQYWYSFDLGPVHFLIFDTEDDFAPGSIQYNFVLEDLKKVDRSKTPWLIAAGHRPMYVASTDPRPYEGDNAVQADLQAAFESIFLEYEVDIVLQGHHHGYQRTCPVFRNKCMSMGEAPVYIDVGNAGAGLADQPGYHFPDHFEVVAYEFGYSRFRANTTDLIMESIRSSNATVIDSLHFSKPAFDFRRSKIRLGESKLAISK